MNIDVTVADSINTDDFLAAIRSAHMLAKHNFFVFPAYPPVGDGRDNDGKIPAVKWSKQRTTVMKRIIDWWSYHAAPGARNPQIMNICIATEPSRLVVIDSDSLDGGGVMNLPLSFKERQTVAVRTGSGGLHLYYRAPEKLRYKNIARPFPEEWPGIDVRAAGGMVLAPPSLHASGNRYRWEDEASPEECEILPLPESLASKLPLANAASDKDHGSGGNQPAKTILGDVHDGLRHQTLLSWAGSMHRRGMSIEAIERAILIENQIRCKPPMKEKDVKKIAESMNKYPPGELPRRRRRRRADPPDGSVNGIHLPWENE